MLPSNKGAFRLFSAFGIQVFLHWSWFIMAYWRFENGKGEYRNPAWMLGEYIALFAIVLMHEFGHSLACKSVGGKADDIILWPFGGIAFVRPPHRAGAYLWSIAAGPLVNVVLIPVFWGINYLAFHGGFALSHDTVKFLENIQTINTMLLIFNVFPIYLLNPAFTILGFVPIYPLDGGQIFQSILWFFLGYAKSILVAAGIGLVAGVVLAGYAFLNGGIWLGFITIFLLSQSWRSFQNAREILKYEKEHRNSTVIDI